MRHMILIYSLLLVPTIILGQTKDLSQNFNKVTLGSVYDGDTFRVHLACK